MNLSAKNNEKSGKSIKCNINSESQPLHHHVTCVHKCSGNLLLLVQCVWLFVSGFCWLNKLSLNFIIYLLRQKSMGYECKLPSLQLSSLAVTIPYVTKGIGSVAVTG